MIALLQRVQKASVIVDETEIAHIRQGWLVFVGVVREDSIRDLEYIADKIISLRGFPSDQSSFDRDIREVNGEILLVSQFTLAADCRKGRRPNFMQAEEPQKARELFEQLALALQDRGIIPQLGQFQAKMQVNLVNDGPVTLWLNSHDKWDPERTDK